MKTAVVWITPEARGGIRTYSDGLWPAVRSALEQSSEFTAHEPLTAFEPTTLRRIRPGLVHVQHEYGLFTRAGVYTFPGRLRRLRRAVPEAAWIATAHAVRGSSYRIPLRGAWLERWLRRIANASVLPLLRREWNEETWRALDAVLVHSELQRAPIEASGQPQVHVVPLFVPDVPASATAAHPRLADLPPEAQVLLVFGFLSDDKGQDLVVRALPELPAATHAVFAGGVRRRQDERYARACRSLAASLGVAARCHILGFVEPAMLDSLYARADLVVCPFRRTTGSASVVEALARGRPTLVSDLPLNLELDQRTPGAVATFRSDDPSSLAQAAGALLAAPAARAALGSAARLYARTFTPAAVAARTLAVYRRVLEARGRVC